MRRLLTLDCHGATLAASLDEAGGETGLLFVTGGTQTRIGSHRLFERLALRLSRDGWPCLRFDRRGVGDSEGEDPDWKDSGPDLAAAASAFRQAQPQLKRVLGFGLCDGASALAMHGADAGLSGFILVNPWFVEAEAGAPPAAAIKSHYREQLLSLQGWKRLLSGSISYRKVLKGLSKVVSSRPSTLAAEIAAALVRARRPAQLILATRDATAIAAEAEWRSAAFRQVRGANPPPVQIDSDSHTFSRPGDEAALLAAVEEALARLSGRG
ncbi:MAG TPA: hydrolase 1, exosortase A system-associated [Allosphingosinicella sp.]|nr:hydrolase 1, exosortase A system-associated [Allosphingosinicella sp.]